MSVHGNIDTCMAQIPAAKVQQRGTETVGLRELLTACMQEGAEAGMGAVLPETVPWMTVPFLSSIWTVSLDSFIKNLQA